MTLTETPLSDNGHTLQVRALVNPKSAACGIGVTSSIVRQKVPRSSPWP